MAQSILELFVCKRPAKLSFYGNRVSPDSFKKHVAKWPTAKYLEYLNGGQWVVRWPDGAEKSVAMHDQHGNYWILGL